MTESVRLRRPVMTQPAGTVCRVVRELENGRVLVMLGNFTAVLNRDEYERVRAKNSAPQVEG